MKPGTRRVVQAVLYEVFAVAAVGPALALMFNEPFSSTLGLAFLMSTVALGWNYVFNGWFERWEARQAVKGRSFKRRLAHGTGFEGGLVVLLVPIMAWWLDTSLLKALVADLGVLAFFFVYAVVFTWAFDRVFGLPQSAAPPAEG
ncbi:MAG: PACE efflux transporter [Paucibacter sp.]|nr:PACE efflux transporter [Roseateles sp.]